MLLMLSNPQFIVGTPCVGEKDFMDKQILNIGVIL